jgi:hypothetical protein
VVRELWVAFLVLAAGTVTMAAAQTSNKTDQPTLDLDGPIP